ncbi:MAG TPA: sulfotransferase [Candidatus Krumholzibacteria bacterium]|nr:sulfotransferase [Candidatus Krumholzibacteria bacterium]
MIYVVLGMHKSGTTLVSQILHRSGIDMGDFDESVSYDGGNKYERDEPVELDMAIMGAPDTEVLFVETPDQPVMTAEQRARMRAIIADCSARHADWGFKDPRACLLYDLWAEELPPHRIIAVHRDPDEVWPHFKWRGLRRHHTNLHRAYAYLRRWHEHNAALLRILPHTSCEWIMLGHRELMSDPAEFARLERFVGRPLTDARRPELYRNRPSRDIVLRTAAWLLARRRGLRSGPTMAALAALRRRGAVPA